MTTQSPTAKEFRAVTGDSVTAFRRELKYVFRSFDFDRVLAILDARCERLQFGAANVSAVSSIYFDDDRLTSVWESMSGISNRIKLRLRWYDAQWPDRTSVFEVKRRAGAAVFKDRCEITLNRSIGEMSYNEILSAVQRQLSPTAATWLSQRRTPTVLVRYDRRHYREPFSGARLTVDYNIRGYDQLGRVTPSQGFPIDLHERVVLEMKVSPGEETSAARRLRGLITRPARSSKLVLCCARFGWKLLPDLHD